MRRMLSVVFLALFTFTASAAPQTKAQCAKLTTCPADGCGAKRDPDLNKQKNRTGVPSQASAVTFAEFVAFNAKAVNKKTRSTWTDADKSKVADIEDGPGVVLTAYLFDATLSDAETCNCYKATATNRDFHIWLAENKAGATKKKFVVVEMTPRIRSGHSEWALAGIKALKPKAGKPWTLVRVKGYPFFDSEHWNFPQRKIRATAWEIHPVTEFSYCTTGDNCNPAGAQGWKKLGQ
jgi:hypothetical protein